MGVDWTANRVRLSLDEMKDICSGVNPFLGSINEPVSVESNREKTTHKCRTTKWRLRCREAAARC